MIICSHLKPKFWDHSETDSASSKYLFNFRRIWRYTVLITLGVALIPLTIMAVIDYRVGRDAMLSEIMLRTSRLTSNTRRNINAFIKERKSALDFISHSDAFSDLVNQRRLEKLLDSIQKSFGGFVDLGVIDHRGIQLTYAGPFDLEGRDYSNAEWFKQVYSKGIYISDVFSGFRNVPHMVIAVKHVISSDRFYVIRATLDAANFNDLFKGLEVGGEGDVFLISKEGVLQTTSKKHGPVLSKLELSIPPFSEHSEVEIINGVNNKAQIIRGYAYIPNTPFILMIIKHKSELLASWKNSRNELVAFLLFSYVAILLVVLGGITYLVNQIYLVDHRRISVMHQAEYTHKMSSLGQLSAGVAHEINNPLAIINQKAGLIKDLFTFKNQYAQDDRLMELINSILKSVDRCADITRRLLNFARRSNTHLQPVELSGIISEVLGFMGKEAEYRSIGVNIDVDNNIPKFQCDPGRLQEILLNLFTNAFAAMDDGGKLNISASISDEKPDKNLKQPKIIMKISDTGHGIPQNDLERVFEPFFSTRIGKGGTGLGLSITYGLIQELGGVITVQSEVGKGATFEVVLPLNPVDATPKTNAMRG